MPGVERKDTHLFLRQKISGLYFALTGSLIATAILNIGDSGIALFYTVFAIPILSIFNPRGRIDHFFDRSSARIFTSSIGIMAFLLLATFVHIFSGMTDPASELFHLATRLGLILYFLICQQYLQGPLVENTKKWLRRVLTVIFIYGIYQVPAKLLGLPLFLEFLRNNRSSFIYKYDQAGWIGMVRATSIFAEPSQATVPILVFCILNATSNRNIWSKNLGWLIVVAFATMTFSRTAWAVILVIVFTSLVMKVKKFRDELVLHRSAVFGVLLVIILLAPAWAMLYHSKSMDLSAVERTESISFGIRMIRHSPLFGYGWNSMPTLQYRYINSVSGADIDISFIHNMIVSYIQQAGIPGFLLAIFPFYTVMFFSTETPTVTYATLLGYLAAAELGGDIGYSPLTWLWIALLINSNRPNSVSRKIGPVRALKSADIEHKFPPQLSAS